MTTSEVSSKAGGTEAARIQVRDVIGLDNVARFATVVGILLPVAGATSRELAFWLSGDIPLGVGSAQPLPALAVYGVSVVLPGTAMGLYIYWNTRSMGPVLGGHDRSSLRSRAVRWSILGILLVVFVLVLATGTWSGVFAVALGWFGGQWSARRFRPGPIVLADLVFLAAATTIGFACVGALGPSKAGTYLADVSFTRESDLADGVYSVLADDGTTMWMVDCANRGAPIRGRTQDVVSLRVVEFGSPKFPTVIDNVRSLEIGPVGFNPYCP